MPWKECHVMDERLRRRAPGAVVHRVREIVGSAEVRKVQDNVDHSGRIPSAIPFAEILAAGAAIPARSLPNPGMR